MIFEADKAPPLSVWVVVLIFLGCFLIFLSTTPYISSWFPDKSHIAYFKHYEPRVKEGNQRRLIVALGASSLRQAIYGDAKMVSALEAVHLSWLKVTSSGGMIMDFWNSIPVILALNPSVLILSEEILREKEPPKLQNPFLSSTLDATVDLSYTWVRSLNLANQKPHPCENTRTKPSSLWLAHERYLKKSFNPAVGLGQKLQQLLQELAARKIQVILLRIPRDPFFVPRVYDHFNRWWATVANQIKPFKNVKVMSPAFSFPTDGFCDPVHMNNINRKLFSDWLIQQLHQSYSPHT